MHTFCLGRFLIRLFLIGFLSMSIIPAAAEQNAPVDPHLWLEEVAGEKPLAWVRERNAVCVAALGETPAFKTLETRILSILDSKEKIPFVTKIGDRYYNFWRDATPPSGSRRRARSCSSGRRSS